MANPEIEVPTGHRGIAKVNLRDMLAESSTFQTATGAGDADAAKVFIHLTEYKAETFIRPFLVVMNVGNDKDERDGTNHFRAGGDLEIRFEQAIPTEYAETPDDAELAFENYYEAVIEDIKALASLSGYLLINSITKIEGPTQFEAESAGTYIYGVRLLVNWGLQ